MRDLKRAQRRRLSENAAGKSRVREWVGGRILAPAYVTEGAPYRVELIVWLELPDDLIVGMEVSDPKAPVAMGDSLNRAMRQPAVGVPRRPARIRVAAAALAAELRNVVPNVEVVVAPTPELDGVVEHMIESMPHSDDSASYFENGRVSVATVENLFRAAASLYLHVPWKVASDEQVLRFDIPPLGVEGACASIIGALGESLGLLVFPSLSGYEAFARSAQAPPRRKLDFGTTFLSLNFEAAQDLPVSMLREAAKHGWPVMSVLAYPRVEHRDRDGLPRPLTERDVRIVTACATALSSFFLGHREHFEVDSSVPVSETYKDDAGLAVRITMPYEAYDVFSPAPVSAEPPPRTATKISRNAPCPCGSGQKYKKCCLDKDAVRPSSGGEPASVHDLHDRLVADMLRFTKSRFSAAWARAAADFDDEQAALPLFVPWLVYGFLLDGRTIVDRFLEDRGRSLSANERDWLQAQQRSWLTLWEVLAVESGKCVTVKDLLSGQERTVHEVSGSRILKKRDTVLARVVDYAGESVFCGMHPRPLSPLEAAEVLQRVRAKLRRNTAIAIERLRDEALGRYLIARWEEAVNRVDAQRTLPPELHNTDGDDLLLTIDHFVFAEGRCQKVEERLRTIDGVQPPEDDDEPYTFLRPGNAIHKDWDTTVIGRAVLSERELALQTNSVRRAGALRQCVERACEGLLRHRAREHSDPQSQRSAAPQKPDRAMQIPSAEEDQIVRAFKARHYKSWIDEALPVLGGMTPRQAARRKDGRERVDVLLKDIENHENRLPGGPQVDLSSIRAQLGLA